MLIEPTAHASRTRGRGHPTSATASQRSRFFELAKYASINVWHRFAQPLVSMRSWPNGQGNWGSMSRLLLAKALLTLSGRPSRAQIARPTPNGLNVRIPSGTRPKRGAKSDARRGLACRSRPQATSCPCAHTDRSAGRAHAGHCRGDQLFDARYRRRGRARS